MRNSPEQILHSIFGYKEFRHSQSEIINTLIQGGDVFVLMPTGGGKSLCYQIPALMRKGTGIIVSPLIALMEDQVATLKQLGISCAFLNSSMDTDSQRATEEQLLKGELELLYVAPERLVTNRMLSLLGKIDVALFAIDEAHCVSQWGHDFRKTYQDLKILHEKFPAVPRIALTATADDRTRQEIVQQLDLGAAKTFVSSFDRPNIRYRVNEGQNAQDQLWKFIQTEHPTDAGIVYCLSRKRVDSVAEALSKKGRIALPYHAGMSDEQRRTNQHRFLREEGVIIVATIAFGMGIDKPNVRFVAHLNLPKNIEAYYQETGRAGRDGSAANAWMAYGLQDVITLRQMMEESNAHQDYKRISHHKLESMLAFCELTSCRRQVLLSYFGETLEKPCGNCDVCLNPPETWDATVVAQKALSCIYRTGQQFGVNYLIDVLSGKEDDRLKSNQHDKLSTFGIGKDLSAAEWRSVFRQLIAHGYINVDVEGYGALRLSEKSRSILKSQQSLFLRKYQKQVVEKKQKEKSSLRSYEAELFDKLKSLRMEIAKLLNVPPYIIFHDTSLEEMSRKRPVTENAFSEITGVGQQKLKKYSEDFIGLIKSMAVPETLNNRLSDTINESLYLLSQGQKVDEIAKQRGLTISTIYGHFSEAIEAGLLSIQDVLDLSEQEIDNIKYEIDVAEVHDHGKLKPVYDALAAEYDYGVLRCVLASYH